MEDFGNCYYMYYFWSKLVILIVGYFKVDDLNDKYICSNYVYSF